MKKLILAVCAFAALQVQAQQRVHEPLPSMETAYVTSIDESVPIVEPAVPCTTRTDVQVNFVSGISLANGTAGWGLATAYSAGSGMVGFEVNGQTYTSTPNNYEWFNSSVNGILLECWKLPPPINGAYTVTVKTACGTSTLSSTPVIKSPPAGFNSSCGSATSPDILIGSKKKGSR